MEEIARKYEIHPNQIGTWKKEFLANASAFFSSHERNSEDKKQLEARRAMTEKGDDISLCRGFMYLCAVIDVHTRYVVNWGISDTMTSLWVRQIVEEVIETHGRPESWKNTTRPSTI